MVLCRCGCGQQTAVATRTNRPEGRVKGQPNSYIYGHSGGAKALPVGRRFGLWTVTGPSRRKWFSRNDIGIVYPVRCECGAERFVRRRDLVFGESIDCGNHPDPPLTPAARTYLKYFEEWLLNPTPTSEAERYVALCALLEPVQPKESA